MSGQPHRCYEGYWPVPCGASCPARPRPQPAPPRELGDDLDRQRALIAETKQRVARAQGWGTTVARVEGDRR